MRPKRPSRLSKTNWDKAGASFYQQCGPSLGKEPILFSIHPQSGAHCGFHRIPHISNRFSEGYGRVLLTQKHPPASLSKRSLYAKQDAMKGCKPFIFHRIHRLCRWGGAIFRSTAQKNHFRSLAMQDESLHPAWSVSKTSFFDTLTGGRF